MTVTERWIVAGSVLVGGILVGAIAGWLVRNRLNRTRGDVTSPIAGATGLLVFWSLTLVGALFSVAMVRPETLEDLPRRMLDYTPRMIAAGLILVAGYAVARVTAGLVGFSIEQAAGRRGLRAALAVKGTIIAAAVILALAQLGVDTTILVLLVGLAGFGLVLAGALLIGLGGRSLAREIAIGRYFGRYLQVGSEISSGTESGRVVVRHPATIEIEIGPGTRRHVRYSMLLEEGVVITGPQDAAETGES